MCIFIFVKNWKVTRSLVSYDSILFTSIKLKTHWKVTRSLVSYDRLKREFNEPTFNWKVTRSLVSYDMNAFDEFLHFYIERSPDHWWVTTKQQHLSYKHLNWKVTRSLVSYDSRQSSSWYSMMYWKVTRSLVSYDIYRKFFFNKSLIERSPDHWWVTTTYTWLIWFVIDWKVTRSLVSYDRLYICVTWS